MVHGRARHSPSQGFIENRNKSVVRFLVKWCMCNKTQIWWLGLPFATLHINSQVNSGTKLSPFHYLYGSEGSTRGIGHLCIPKDRLQRLTNECEFHRATASLERGSFFFLCFFLCFFFLGQRGSVREHDISITLSHEKTKQSNTLYHQL